MKRGHVKDRTGQRFGRLTVMRLYGIYRAPHARKSAAIWLCKCDCGTEILARADHLHDGSVKSCGCMRDDNLRKAQARRWHKNDAD